MSSQAGAWERGKLKLEGGFTMCENVVSKLRLALMYLAAVFHVVKLKLEGGITMCQNVVSKLRLALMYLAAMFQRQGRQLATVCGLAAKVIVIMMFIIGLSGFGNVCCGCQLPPLKVSGKPQVWAGFVGNTNAIIRIDLHECYPLESNCSYDIENNLASATVYRDGQAIGTVTGADDYPFKTVEDTGLTKGQSYTYTAVGNCGVSDATPITVTTGEVRGRIDRDMTWDSSSGDFVLFNGFDDGISVGGWNYEPVTLTIKSGAVVNGTKTYNGISIGVNSKVIVDGATLKGVARIGASYAQGIPPGTRLDITNSTVDNGWIDLVDTFSVKNSVLNNVRIEYVSDFLDQQAFSTNSGSSVSIKLANSKGLMNYIGFSGIRNIYRLSLSLLLTTPASVIDVNDNDNLSAVSVSSKDSTVNIRNNNFVFTGGDVKVSLAGNVAVEGNQGDKTISLTDLQSGSFSSFIRNNTVNNIYLEGASGLTIEQNETEDEGNGYGVWIKKGSGNVVRDNRFYSASRWFGTVPSVGVCIGNEQGIGPGDSTGNQVVNNRIVGFDKGIGICANSNVISGNMVRDSRLPVVLGGVEDSYPVEVSGNSIYDNMFIGQEWGKILCTSCTGVWNMNKTDGPNIVGGKLKGGNYWSVYTEKDNDQDGFIDKPYKLNDYNTDALPLPAPLIVNRTTDEDDADLTDGRCDTDMVTTGDQCTLRAAIQTANARAGSDKIIFDIDQYGVPVISVSKHLPAITGQVIIDASTQESGEVEVNGTSAGDGVNGLQFEISGCEIRGLTVREFSGHGVVSLGVGIRLEDVKVKNNKKHGVYTDGEIVITGDKNEFDFNGEYGLYTAESSVNAQKGVLQAGNNGSYGIYAPKGSVEINFETDKLPSSAKYSMVCDNGLAGIRAEESVSSNFLNVSGNGKKKLAASRDKREDLTDADPYEIIKGYAEGSGIMSGGYIKLNEVKADNNQGDGLHGTYDIKIKGNGNEFNGNRSCGIFSQPGSVDASHAVIQANNNGFYGIWTRGGGININFPITVTYSTELSRVNGNRHGGLRANAKYGDDIGSVHAAYIEVTGNGETVSPNAYTGAGSGIWAYYRVLLKEAKVSSNYSCGVFAESGGVEIQGKGNEFDNNRTAGIWASLGSVNAVVLQARNNLRHGVVAKKGDVIIGSSDGSVSRVSSNKEAGIFAGGGSDGFDDYAGILQGSFLEVVGNAGLGIRTKGALTVNTGKICDNTGGDLFAGGIVTLTDVIRCDGDNDGVSDSVEDLAPNYGDINKDGIPDRLENHVTVVQEVLGGKPQITGFEADGTAVTVSSAHSEYNEDEGGAKYGFNLDTKTSGSRDKREFTAGSTTLVTIWLPEGVKAVGYSAYGPTADNATHHWYGFLYDGTTGAEIQEGKIILHLKDGARGDNDLTANGKIVHEGHHVISGDFTGDGAMGLDDVIAVLRMLAGIEVSITNADLTGDGKTGLEDAVMILQKIAG